MPLSYAYHPGNVAHSTRQQAALTKASQQGRADSAARLRGNLALFEQQQPCRTPWIDLRLFVGG